MKTLTHFIVTFLFVMLCASLSAQTYKTCVIKSDYKDLDNPLVLTGSQPWKNPSARIAIPFGYHYFNRIEDSIYIGPFGVFFTLDQKDVITVAPYDATDKGTGISQSPISYSVTGMEGSRILKLQWKNIGFYKDTSHKDFYNVQLWIYEDSENMEIHLGPCSIQNPYSTCDGQNTSYLFLSNFDGTQEMPLEGCNCKQSTLINPDNGVTYCINRGRKN
jgi:hypothetical protein